MIATVKATVTEILQTLVLLLAPSSVAELRCPKTQKGTISGYFNDFQAMAAEAADLSGKVSTVYITLNPVNPDLLARAVNQIKPYAQNTTGDVDVLKRIWLPTDYDAIRPAGISSTDEEHAAALDRALEGKAWLSEQGWPEPLTGDSGNGGHLLHRVDLPNDENSRTLIKRVLTALSQKFSDTQVVVDTAVGNAARVWKLYGTQVCKGDSTTERPHRFARLQEIPDNIVAVSREQLEAVAALAVKPVAKNKTTGHRAGHRKGKVFNLASWLEEHGLLVSEQAPWEGGTKYILANCPLNPEHMRTAYVCQLPSGALAAGCHHQSCAELDWKRLREMYEPLPGAPEFSDDFVALEFTQAHGEDLKYTASMCRWNDWTGSFWQDDEKLLTFTLARDICRAAGNAASAEPDKARRLASSATTSAVERLARYDPRHAAVAEQWDHDPWLLNTPAGTVDLRTGTMHEHRRSDFITKITTVSPGGGCPLWLQFLRRVTGGSLELQTFLQRMIGYGLTGITREHALFFLYGTGGNGKGVFLNTAVSVLGPYTRIAPIEMLLASRNSGERHPCDMAALRGSRLVTTVEVEKGGRWAEAKLTALTGGDKITARFMHGNFFEFVPQFKLIVVGNHRPGLRTVNEAIRRRFHLVPFTVTIPETERDPKLCEKLKAEYPGVLAWAIEGCLAWQQNGLNPPTVVREATGEYFCDEDVLGRWLKERCVLGRECEASSSALFMNWKEWTENAGEFTGSQKNFGQSLESREGITSSRTSRVRGYKGIRLRTREDPESAVPAPSAGDDGEEVIV